MALRLTEGRVRVGCKLHLFKAKFSPGLSHDLTTSSSIQYKSHMTPPLRQQYQGVSWDPLESCKESVFYAPDLSICLVVATTAVGKTGFSLQCACLALLSPYLSIASQHLLIVQRLGAHSSVASLSICPSSFCSHSLSRVGFCFYTHLLIFLLFLTIWQL